MKNINADSENIFTTGDSEQGSPSIVRENTPEHRRIARLPLAWKPRHRGDLIRLGAEYDGGYVVTETAVNNTGVLVGLGIEHNWAFEEEFHRMSGCAVHCYDHTISFNEFFRFAYFNARAYIMGRAPLDRSRIRLLLKYRKFFSGKRRHYVEKVGPGPGSSDFRKIFSRIPEGKKVFIKMDIEGWEYSVLPGLTDYYSRITGLVIEFHHVVSFPEVMEYSVKELQQQFDIVHVHVNNHDEVNEDGMPITIELTFENKSLRKEPAAESRLSYPVEGLDSPNNSYLPDYTLEFYQPDEIKA